MKLILDPRKLELARLRYRAEKQMIRVVGGVMIGVAALFGVALMLLLFTESGRNMPDRGQQIRMAVIAMCMGGAAGWFMASGAVGAIMDSLESCEHLVESPDEKRGGEDADEKR